MAINAMNWVWAYSRSRRCARLTLLAIADCAKNDDGSGAWPSNKELSRKTGLTDRGVRLAIAELAKLGELAVDLNAGPGGCNRYRILIPPEYCSPRNNIPPQGFGSTQVNGHTPEQSSSPEQSSPRNKVPRTPEQSSAGTIKEPKNSPTESSSSKRTSPKPERDDVERICAHLADRIVANGSKRPAVTAQWRTEARLLLDKDGRTEEQAHTAIDWCQGNSFWRSKVMSMPKLRVRYDVLRLEAIAEREKQAANGRASPGRQQSPVSPRDEWKINRS